MRFFLRMIYRSFSRQLGRRILIALTVCLSTSVSVAMLGVVFDVGDKVNEELSTYGSNIVVQPRTDAMVSDLYTTVEQNQDPTAFLDEADLVKIKTIFWAYNITNFIPTLDLYMQVDADSSSSSTSVVSSQEIQVHGTWFDKILTLPTGGTTEVGLLGMREWWTVDGNWPEDDTNQVMVGVDLAEQLGVTIGNTLTLSKNDNSQVVEITAIYTAGDEDDQSLYLGTALAQELADLGQVVNQVEVKALTTPENDLARKAASNPAALTLEEWETWYCTAYPSSIAYQIEEVLPGAVAKQVRQVAALQGDVLEKTEAVMIIMTVLSLVSATIAVANLMTSAILERAPEFALMKAIGATNGAIARAVLMETTIISLIGAIIGAGIGIGAAQLIGYVVFGSSISLRPMVFLLVAVLLAITLLVASTSSIRTILKLKPAEVLHGK